MAVTVYGDGDRVNSTLHYDGFMKRKLISSLAL